MKTRVPILASMLVAVSLLTLDGPATADSSSFARAADTIIVVEVSFVPYGNLVLLKEVLAGDRSLLRSPEEYLGNCLLGKAEVRAQAQSGGKAATHYQAALERAGYSAVLFLKRSETGSTPLCESTQPEPVHWEQHPEHAGWRTRLDTVLTDR